MFIQDKLFWLALLAGPVFWFGLWLTGYSQPGQGDAFYLGLMVVLIYPLLEELAFRGWLQGMLLAPRLPERTFAGLSLANIITSIIFTLFHLLTHAPLWAIAVFAPSLVFGFFRDRYHSVQPSICLHVFYNAGFYLLFTRFG